MSDLMIKIGARYRRATASEICEHASTYMLERMQRDRVTLSSPAQSKQYLRNLAGLDHEKFGVIYMNNRHTIIRSAILFSGTIDGASVYPREVVKTALLEGAAAVILFHNHPSGVPEPSGADETITDRLKNALSLIDVRVLDHFIIAGDSIVSFAERGLI